MGTRKLSVKAKRENERSEDEKEEDRQRQTFQGRLFPCDWSNREATRFVCGHRTLDQKTDTTEKEMTREKTQ
jgi:hypothetical protein